jgi:dihydropteroate synthase
MRILQVHNPGELKQVMRSIDVDAYGIKIMVPKAISRLVRINSISNITANILKQEMLSLGGDAAVARGALTGRTKRTDCLLMGSLSQYNRLQEKLNRQPFGLDKLAGHLREALENYQKNDFSVNLGRYKLRLGRRAYIMGIVNVTPDSFSGDGLLISQKSKVKSQTLDHVINYAENLVRDGADIIDVGGESSRPGASRVSVKEELKRTIPVIKSLAKRVDVPISIDTYKPEVARQALDNGAVMVNDISGLRDPRMAKVAAKYKAGVVIMHMKGRPRNMQKNPVYTSLLDEIIAYLDNAVKFAGESGIKPEKIIIDPGIGFGKTLEHNLEILKRLSEFKTLGRPIMVGVSRKSFLGRILKAGPRERFPGSLSSACLAVKNGAHIVRVHEVKETKEALKILDALNHA